MSADQTGLKKFCYSLYSISIDEHMIWPPIVCTMCIVCYIIGQVPLCLYALTFFVYFAALNIMAGSLAGHSV